MSLTDLMPAIHALPKEDKRQLLHFLAADLENDDPAAFLPQDSTIPLWTPIEAFDAAKVLTDLLESERSGS